MSLGNDSFLTSLSKMKDKFQNTAFLLTLKLK